jgi:hypothetical protein
MKNEKIVFDTFALLAYIENEIKQLKLTHKKSNVIKVINNHSTD